MRLTNAQAKAAIVKWAEILKINPLYKFHVTVNNAPDPEVRKSERKNVQAHIRVDEAYYNLRLTLNAYEFKADELDHVIAHELVHVVLARFSLLAFEAYGEDHQTTARNLMESTTEQIAQALIRAHGKKVK